MQVRNLMTKPAVTISEQMLMRHVIELMEIFRVRCVPVLRDGALVGMLTPAQAMGARWAPAASGTRKPDERAGVMARDVMLREVVTVSPEMTASDALRLAWRPHPIASLAAEFLAVMEHGEVVGIVATGDLAAALCGGSGEACGETIAHVLAATTLTPPDAATVDEALRLAREHRAKLTLLHALPALPDAMRDLPEGVRARVQRARRMTALSRLMSVCPREPRIGWLVVEGEPASEIVWAATRLPADVIVLRGTRSAPGGPGITGHVIERAPCRVHLVGTPETSPSRHRPEMAAP